MDRNGTPTGADRRPTPSNLNPLGYVRLPSSPRRQLAAKRQPALHRFITSLFLQLNPEHLMSSSAPKAAAAAHSEPVVYLLVRLLRAAPSSPTSPPNASLISPFTRSHPL